MLGVAVLAFPVEVPVHMVPGLPLPVKVDVGVAVLPLPVKVDVAVLVLHFLMH